MKKLVILYAIFSLFIFTALSYGANKNTPAAKTPKATQVTPMPEDIPKNIVPPIKTNILFGEIISIDQANSTVKIKNTVTSEESTVSYTPTTSVTKVTDMSDLKQGDNIRVIYQDASGKKTARAIMFGKIKVSPVMPKQAITVPVTPKSTESIKK